MKKIRTLFIICIIFSIELFAQVPVQYYDFEINSTRTTGETSAEFIVNNVGGSTVTSSDSTLSDASGNPSGGTAMKRGWPIIVGDPGVGATSYIEFQVSSSGFSGLSVGIDVISSLASLDNIT